MEFGCALRRYMWLGGSVVVVLDSWPRGCWFDSQPVRYQVSTLGNLFAFTYLCSCTFSNGWFQQLAFRLRFNSHRRSFANNLEQVANLLCAQANSAFYPQRNQKWPCSLRAMGWRPVRLIWAVVCLLASNRRSADAGSGWPHSALRYII